MEHFLSDWTTNQNKNASCKYLSLSDLNVLTRNKLEFNAEGWFSFFYTWWVLFLHMLEPHGDHVTQLVARKTWKNSIKSELKCAGYNAFVGNGMSLEGSKSYQMCPSCKYNWLGTCRHVSLDLRSDWLKTEEIFVDHLCTIKTSHVSQHAVSTSTNRPDGEGQSWQWIAEEDFLLLTERFGKCCMDLTQTKQYWSSHKWIFPTNVALFKKEIIIAKTHSYNKEITHQTPVYLLFVLFIKQESCMWKMHCTLFFLLPHGISFCFKGMTQLKLLLKLHPLLTERLFWKSFMNTGHIL